MSENNNIEVPIFTNIRNELPLYNYLNYKYNQRSNQNVQQPISNVIILAALEFTEELRSDNWIECDQQLNQLPIETIKIKLINNLEYQYKNFKYQIQSVRGFYQPTLNEIKKHLANQQVKQGKFIVHYIGRLAMLQLEDGIVMSQDEIMRTPLAVSVTEVAKMLQDQFVFYIFDTNYAGLLVDCLAKIVQNVNNKYELIAFGACASNQKLPYMQQPKQWFAPTDIFSFCFLNPLQALFIAYVYKQQTHLGQESFQTFPQISQYYKDKIASNPSIQEQLSFILRCICENIAQTALPSEKFVQLCRQDKQTCNVICNFFVAQRVMKVFNCDSCTTMQVSDFSDSSLWSSFDMCINQALTQSSVITEKNQVNPEENESLSRIQSFSSTVSVTSVSQINQTNMQPQQPKLKQHQKFQISFVDEQIQSFELQLNQLQDNSKCPENLSIIITFLEQGYYRQRCLWLLSKFVDICPNFIEFTVQNNIILQILKCFFAIKQYQDKINQEYIFIMRYGIFLLNKLIAHDLCYIKYIKNFRSQPNVSDKDFIWRAIVKLIKDSKTSVSDRLHYLQFVALLLNQKVIEIVIDSTKEGQQFLPSFVQILIQNGGLQVIHGLSQSIEGQTRVLSILIMSELLPFYIDQLNKNKSNSSTDNLSVFTSKKPTFMQNQQEQNISFSKYDFSELNELASYYSQILVSDNIVEVKSACALVINNIFPDIQKQQISEDVQMGKCYQDLYENSVDLKVYEALQQASQDVSPFIRIEVYNCCLKHAFIYFGSCFWKTFSELIVKVDKKLLKEYECGQIQPFATYLIDTIKQGCSDPISVISIQCQTAMKCFENLAMARILSLTRLNRAFYSMFCENIKDQMTIDEKKVCEIQQRIFEEWQLNIVKNHPITSVSINSDTFYQKYANKPQSDSEMVGKSLSGVQKVESLKISEENSQRMEPQKYSVQVRSEKMLSDSQLSIPQIKNSPIVKQVQPNLVQKKSNFEFDAINPPDDSNDSVPPQNVKVQEQNDDLPIFEDDVIDFNEEQQQKEQIVENPSFVFSSNIDKIKFEFLTQKLQKQQNFDLIMFQIAHYFNYNKFYLQQLHQKSAQYSLLLQSIRSTSIVSNALQLAQTMSTFVHRTLSGCSMHNTFCCKDCGSMSNRSYNMRCQVCNKPSFYCENLVIPEISIKNLSSCFSLSLNQRQDISKLSQEMKRVDSVNSIFATLLQNSIKHEILKQKQHKLTIYLQQLHMHKSESTKNIVGGIIYMVRLFRDDQFEDIMKSVYNKVNEIQNLKPLPDECQSFIFAYPVNDTSECLQENIVLHVSNNAAEMQSKQKSSKRQPLKWIDSIQTQRNAQGTNNLNILTEGFLQQQLLLQENQQLTSQLLLQPIKLIQQFDGSLTNVDVNILSQTIEQVNNLLFIDQSCQHCRQIAVRKGLLEKCAKSNKSSNDDQKNKQFIYYPTKDYTPLYQQEQRKKMKVTSNLDFEKNISSSQQFQTYIQQFINTLASPFAYFDALSFCNSSSSTFSHSQMGRVLYRLAYCFEDHMSHFSDICSESEKQMESFKKCSVINMLQLSQLLLAEDKLITYFQQIQLMGNRQTQRSISSFVLNDSPIPITQKPSEYKFLELPEKYEQAQFSNINFKEISKISDLYLREQNIFISKLNEDTLSDYALQYQIVSQFQCDKGLNQLTMHPKLPFVAYFNNIDNNIVLFNYSQRLVTNIIDQTTILDISPHIYSQNLLKHQHADLQKHSQNIKHMTNLMQGASNSTKNMYYAYLQDRDLEAFECPLCLSIKEQNQFNQPLRDYDFYDQNCQKAMDTTQRYTNEHVNMEFSEFFEQDTIPSVTFPKYLKNKLNLSNPVLLDMQFLNTKTPFQLLGCSFDDYCFRLFQNPFDFGISRITSAFRVFQQKQQYSLNSHEMIPIFDALRRMSQNKAPLNQSYEQVMQTDLMQMYIQCRLSTCLNDLQGNLPLEQRGNFLMSQWTERVIFEKNEIETDQLGVNTITASNLNGNIMCFGSVDGGIQLFDVRAGSRINMFRAQDEVGLRRH